MLRDGEYAVTGGRKLSQWGGGGGWGGWGGFGGSAAATAAAAAANGDPFGEFGGAAATGRNVYYTLCKELGP